MKRRADTRTIDLFDEQWAWLFATEPISATLLEEESPWTETEILHLFEYVLHDALTRLTDARNSVETRRELFQWVTTEGDRNPFSFENCCRFAGLDPEVVREGIALRMAEWRKSLH